MRSINSALLDEGLNRSQPIGFPPGDYETRKAVLECEDGGAMLEGRVAQNPELDLMNSAPAAKRTPGLVFAVLARRKRPAGAQIKPQIAVNPRLRVAGGICLYYTL